MPSRTESPNGRMRKGSKWRYRSTGLLDRLGGERQSTVLVGGIHSSRAQARARGEEWYIFILKMEQGSTILM